MNTPSRDNNRYLMLTLLAGMTIVILLLAGFLSIVGAQTELDEPPVPLRMVKANNQPQAVTEPIDVNNLGPKWRPVFTEGFESANWRDNWLFNTELSKPPLGYIWGVRKISDNPSEHAAWAIGGGDNGDNLELINPSYPAGVDSWLVAGPFDFTNAEDALVTLDLFYEANQGDPFSVGISEELISGDFVEQQPVIDKDVNKNEGSWEQLQWSLSAYIGKPTIYVAFTFSSAAGDIEKLGALMDNVQVWVEGEPGTYLPIVAYGFTPTPPPPTVEPPPGGDYEKNFTNNIDGWLDRRATFGTQFSLSHDPSADGGYSGFLNLLVNTSGSHYVIASPLVAGKTPPYNIETVVKMRSPREDGDQYGIVFGGNYDPSAGECRAEANGSCFTQYYEMRVYYFHDDEADKDRMNMKLKRIDGVDSNNNNVGEDLIDWTRVSDVEENDFIEWDITVEADGKIKISANENPVDSATDSTYINNPYFGVIVRTEDHSDAEAKFDYFKVD